MLEEEVAAVTSIDRAVTESRVIPPAVASKSRASSPVPAEERITLLVPPPAAEIVLVSPEPVTVKLELDPVASREIPPAVSTKKSEPAPVPVN